MIVFQGRWKSEMDKGNYESRIFRMNDLGEDLRDLGAGYLPAVSPDGRKVAFTRDLGERNAICILDLEDSTACRVRVPEAADGPHEWRADGTPAWSPDGTRIAFPAYASGPGTHGVAILDLLTDEIGFLATGSASLLTWPEPGNRVLFRHGVDRWQAGCFLTTLYGLFWVEPASGETGRFGDQILTTWEIAPLPDSPEVLVVLGSVSRRLHLSAIDTVTGREREIARDLPIAEGPIWSDPGRKAMLTCDRTEGERGSIFREIEVASGESRVIGNAGGYDCVVLMDWLPRSSRLLVWFQKVRRTMIEEDYLAVVDPVSGELTRIGPPGLEFSMPQVRPAGR
ncbi:MAG: PD40 domain-containing protein [Planctomycetes bacterium]|nr:PD40 domain-containing protein [Planctomycetota bacterium]